MKFIKALIIGVFMVCTASQGFSKPKKVKLDHAGIILSLTKTDYKAGEVIYQGLCVNCHGADGKTAPLPTARAFGSQPFKFGSDPYAIYKTLTKGNGLMGPMLHLSHHERYQVAHYIIEKFVKPFDNGYRVTSDQYLESLPKGKDLGKGESQQQRDFGPGLASQLGRDISNVMSVRLDGLSMAYDLHTMNQAQVWNGGYLDYSDTQHSKLRGGGVVEIEGSPIEGLQGWQWAHEGRFDYPTDHLLPRGPMPKEWMDYKGHYLHDKNIIFAYSIDQRPVLEMPEGIGGAKAMIHAFEIHPGDTLKLTVAQLETDDDFVFKHQPHSSSMSNADHFTAAKCFGDIEGLSWEVDSNGKMILTIPASKEIKTFKVLRYTSQDQLAEQGFNDICNLMESQPFTKLSNKTRGGELRWAEVLETKGHVSDNSKAAYVIDTLTLPDSNPWNTWFRTTALDFFSDGRMALSTHGGDIWIVSNIDNKLENIQWKRYASGLYEPFGVRVINNTVYVTCKDRLTRLHDYNQDGEADFYESFYADEDVSTFFHAYNFDLQTDREGNFYYAKAGQYTSYKHPGSVLKIPPEGGRAEIYCTGFRTPNGMGITKNGFISVSDNEGNWMPASKVSLTKPKGFYGYVQTKTNAKWQPDGGKIDVTKVIPPETFDPPLMWIPKYIDNSSGGQLWVNDPRWGPLGNRFLHTSFGKGHLFYFIIQDVGELHQAALVRLPYDFNTGIMRARVNPSDGQVYTTGLNGWNGGGRPGLAEGGVQRLRYTGQALKMISAWKVHKGQIELGFNFPVSASSNQHHFQGKQWNYQWTENYGSKTYKPSDGEPGCDPLNIDDLLVDDDANKIILKVDDLKPVDQIELNLSIQAKDGTVFSEQLWVTIHRVID